MNHDLDTDLETALRTALLGRAGAVPAEAAARVRTVDYRPRTRRLTPRMTVGAVTGAATAGAVASVVVLGGAPPAFAGWSPTPTTPTRAQSASAGASCLDHLGAVPVPAETAATAGPWTSVVTDVRGPFTVGIYRSTTSGDFARCFTGPSLSAVVIVGTSGHPEAWASSGAGARSSSPGSGGMSYSSVAADRSGSGGIEQYSVAHLWSTADGAYSVVEGQVGAGVSAVTVVRRDGRDVEATTAGGWFVAWWPGSDGLSSALVTDDGTTTAVKLDLPAPPPPPASASACPPASTPGGPSSSAGGAAGSPTLSCSGATAGTGVTGGAGGSGGGVAGNS